MAAGKINLQKESGGITKISSADGTGVTELVVPESGTLATLESPTFTGTPKIGNDNIASISTSVTDNSIARYNGTTGKLQGSGVFIDDNSNVGIGDSAPQYKLSIGQSIPLPSTAGSKITSFSKYTNVGSNVSYLRFNTVRASEGSSHNTTEERIQKVIDITEMGYIGFGDQNVVFGTNAGKLATLNTIEGFAVNAGAYSYQNYWSNSSRPADTNWRHFYGTSNNNTVANIIIYGNGTIQNATNSYGAFSDIKLKENILDVSPKLDKLMKVRVVNYNLIGQEQKQIGVIAQEIEQIFPSLIDETKDIKQVEIEKERLIPALDEIVDNDGNVVQEAKPEYIEKYMDTETIETGETTKSVKYSVLYMIMLKGMQEQQEIINDLKLRIEKLELGAK